MSRVNNYNGLALAGAIRKLQAKDQALKVAADRIAELESAWISVDERLPEPNRIVLIDGGIGHITNDGFWYTDTAQDAGRLIQWKVTHWMPLPLPPTEGK